MVASGQRNVLPCRSRVARLRVSAASAQDHPSLGCSGALRVLRCQAVPEQHWWVSPGARAGGKHEGAKSLAQRCGAPNKPVQDGSLPSFQCRCQKDFGLESEDLSCILDSFFLVNPCFWQARACFWSWCQLQQKGLSSPVCPLFSFKLCSHVTYSWSIAVHVLHECPFVSLSVSFMNKTSWPRRKGKRSGMFL